MTALTQEEFINRSKAIWGDKFDYSLVVYKGAKSKIKLICPKHGVFKQQAGGHLYGKDCRYCARESNGEFLSRNFFKKKPTREDTSGF